MRPDPSIERAAPGKPGAASHGKRQTDTMESLVFVFGTLKEGFPNFSTNRGVRVPGSFRTVVPYPLYLVGERHSPWLLDEPGAGHCVVGELYRVDPAVLAAMDKLERVFESDGYRRKPLEIGGSERELLSAYAYLKQPHHLSASDIRLGPLREYEREHAALYRPRAI